MGSASFGPQSVVRHLGSVSIQYVSVSAYLVRKEFRLQVRFASLPDRMLYVHVNYEEA
jgi:hypothetical protein